MVQMLLFRYIDLNSLLNEFKRATARKKTHNIKLGLCNISCNLRYKPCITINIKKIVVKQIKQFNEQDLKQLNYNSINEYLNEPFNSDLTINDYKKLIFFDIVSVNYDVLQQYNLKDVF